MLPRLSRDTLPHPAPARVLACGAWLKNRACLVDGDAVWWSPPHGDLGGAEARAALAHSVEGLLARARGPLHAVAHDLHPDFPSTHVAVALAGRLAVPAVGVQHHHAHIGVVLAEQGVESAVVGWALDGVGLGADGAAWGGELLCLHAGLRAHDARRLGHLFPLALPGGDAAAREPWRMAASALHAAGLHDQIVPRFGPVVGAATARGLAHMLDKRLHCPPSTSAGRWFDAVAGLLGLCVRQADEAQAALALERCAGDWLAAHPHLQVPWPSLDLRALVPEWLALGAPGPHGAPAPAAQGRGAAMFHLALVAGLSEAAVQAAAARGIDTVVLAGGCFLNQLLSARLTEALQAAGLRVQRPTRVSCGDAGLALGQAWIAACALADGAPLPLSSLKD